MATMATTDRKSVLPIAYDTELAGKAAGYHSTRFYAHWLSTGDAGWHGAANVMFALYEDLFADANAIEASRIRRRARSSDLITGDTSHAHRREQAT